MNHLNKKIKVNPLSLVGDKYSKILKGSSVVILAAAFIVSGFFAPSSALAEGGVNISVATGGEAVLIDTTRISDGGTGVYTPLEAINISETAPGQITAGLHTISLPSGWEFNTSAHITAFKGDGLTLTSYNITPGLTSFSFNVVTPSITSTFITLAGM